MAFDDVELAYYALAVDSEGLPMLPDDARVMRAFELYVKQKWFTMLFDMGKILVSSLKNVQEGWRDSGLGDQHGDYQEERFVVQL